MARAPSPGSGTYQRNAGFAGRRGRAESLRRYSAPRDAVVDRSFVFLALRPCPCVSKMTASDFRPRKRNYLLAMHSAETFRSPDSPTCQYRYGYIWMISLVAALGGLLFGYDWVVIGGAKPFFERYFGLSNEYVRGWVNSCALLGCLSRRPVDRRTERPPRPETVAVYRSDLVCGDLARKCLGGKRSRRSCFGGF